MAVSLIRRDPTNLLVLEWAASSLGLLLGLVVSSITKDKSTDAEDLTTRFVKILNIHK